MILIDSVFVNVGGTKVLLEYLLESIDKNLVDDYFLLLDYRNENRMQVDISQFSHQYVNGFLERKKFYKCKGKSFTKILCFGNIPPNIKLPSAKVLTYFHQQLFLNVPSDFSWQKKLMYFIKVQILKILRNNTDLWLVQSELMKAELARKYDLEPKLIEVLPFYPTIKGDSKYTREKNTFIYVSDATPHKNHYRLIMAFCKFYDKYKVGKLTLTIPENAVQLIEYLNTKISENYPIVNIGFIDRKSLYRHYSRNEYLIFPSLAESFGLGLVEAIDCGCKIIAADLPYTYQVCEPSITFNPLDVESIYKALSKTQSLEKIDFAQKKVDNNMGSLLNLLQN